MKVIAKFSAPLEKFENGLWAYHIKVDHDVMEMLKQKKIKRFMVSLNNQEAFHSSATPAGNGIYYIMISKQLRKVGALHLGQDVEVTISEDRSKYGIGLPEEMEELLLVDQEGSDYFHGLTPGKQRSLLHLVDKIKNPNLRIEKSIIILEHLKEQRGKLDFKILMADFKNKKGTV